MRFIHRQYGESNYTTLGRGGELYLGYDLGKPFGMAYGLSMNGILTKVYADLCRVTNGNSDLQIGEFTVERLASNFRLNEEGGDRALEALDEVGAVLFKISRDCREAVKDAYLGHMKAASLGKEAPPKVYPIMPEGGRSVVALQPEVESFVNALGSALQQCINKKESAAA